MPNIELRVVEYGARSTLYCSEQGSLYRHYLDTNLWSGPLAPTVDARGTSRHSHNRNVSLLVDKAWKEYRGEGDHGNHTIRPQDHLRLAMLHLIDRQTSNIETFAELCGVKVSTAWSYLCKIVELWPRTHEFARAFVYDPLLSTCSKNATCLHGSLRSVMERIRTDLCGDTEWRCLKDHYSHLRLARICMEAERRVSESKM